MRNTWYINVRDRLFGLNVSTNYTKTAYKCMFSEVLRRDEKDKPIGTPFDITDVYNFPEDSNEEAVIDTIKMCYNLAIKSLVGLENYDEIEWNDTYSVAYEKRKAYVEEMLKNKVKEEGRIVKIEEVILNTETKRQITQVIDFINKAEKYTEIGADFPHGFLLVGEPGTGKTLISKAISTECGCNFASYSGAEFANKYVGVGPQKIKSIFEEARNKKPSIIFIDELDSLCLKRDEDTGSEDLKMLTQLLSEMDGMKGNDGVFVIGATNQPELLDSAVTREGRFTRKIKIEKPNYENRVKIFELYLKRLKCEEGLDVELYAELTEGCNGAKISTICNEAGIYAVDNDRTKVSNEDVLFMINRYMSYEENENEVSNKPRIGFNLSSN